MRGTAVSIVIVLSLSLGVACTTSLEISFDPREDFGHYNTWEWVSGADSIPYAPTAQIIGLERIGLERDLSRLIEAALLRRGLERVQRGADLRVGVVLNLRREVVIVQETGAMEYLSSLHASPSFEVQTTVRREETHVRSRLVVFAIDARHGQVVWKGALDERFRSQFSPHLERSVANLLQRFPLAGSKEPLSPDPDPGDRDLRERDQGRTKFTASPSLSEPDA